MEYTALPWCIRFYLEYGTLSANITVPLIIMGLVASGELLNEKKEVYTKEEISRWNSARSSEKTVMIHQNLKMSENNSGTKPGNSKLKKQRFPRPLQPFHY